ncbi:hypothetical protein HPSA50_1842 [Helicobacter pylori SouthAfrica50]|uniref:Uncharacterized protein n=1 Tax=Helicobacter pylori SouthAfrica50 TaxID=1352357 RepID=T2SB70_HELPX|nr:hypothetical protein HPSA50_1842 [Helicobacter pylori SouthAfrica50]
MGVKRESFKIPPIPLKNELYSRNEFYNKIKNNETNFKTLFLNFKLSLNSAIFKFISL